MRVDIANKLGKIATNAVNIVLRETKIESKQTKSTCGYRVTVTVEKI